MREEEEIAETHLKTTKQQTFPQGHVLVSERGPSDFIYENTHTI